MSTWIRGFISLCLAGASITSCKTGSGKGRVQDLAGPSTFVSQKSDVKVTFLGTTTLLFDDGETQWMTDAFFTRPNLLKIGLGKIRSDEAVIDRILARVGVKKLAAVIAIHSHYDHVMDAPLVAKKTEALLVGSNSTAMVGRGSALPENRIQVVKDGDELNFGKWKVTFILSEHSPDPEFAGEISKPLIPPASVNQYRAGESYSLLVEHEGRSLLVHGSAGYIPGKLQGKNASAVYLGIGGVGKMGAQYCDDYWRETIEALRSKRVFVVHWDDVNRSLDEPLTPASGLLDKLEKGMECLKGKAKTANVELQLPQAFKVTYPFPPST